MQLRGCRWVSVVSGCHSHCESARAYVEEWQIALQCALRGWSCCVHAIAAAGVCRVVDADQTAYMCGKRPRAGTPGEKVSA